MENCLHDCLAMIYELEGKEILIERMLVYDQASGYLYESAMWEYDDA